ncbi:OmpA family protein [Sorangium sp. So ce1389]|uniref:OmpA family protein n=1 Tax=Sorangium sp. So ce1389 TaxID=3133336 RepID=UPI003F5EAD22
MSNYDINVDKPKPEHETFLDTTVVPILLRKMARVWLQGSASSTGSAAHNMALSQRRAENVADHLLKRGVLFDQIQIDAVGDNVARSPIRENADDRAVSLLAAPLVTLPPNTTAPTPTPEPGAPTATRFRIRMLRGVSASVGKGWMSNEMLFFQIWDPANGVTSYYVYASMALSRGVPSIQPTLQGEWNDFDTTAAIAVNEFDGTATFKTGGVVCWSVNYLQLIGLPRGIVTVPNPISMSTGCTFGLGISASKGKMILYQSGSFSGP